MPWCQSACIPCLGVLLLMALGMAYTAQRDSSWQALAGFVSSVVDIPGQHKQ